MYHKVLLAFDGSPDGREALAQAEKLASMCGATVHLLAIIDPSESMLIVETTSFIPDNQRFVVQAVLDEGVKRLRSAGCSAAGELKYGKPAEQIILSAREINADLVVVGSVLVAVKSEHRASNVTPIQQLNVRGKR